ncbi:MAG: translesion error-prone DNA polymerase V autoproteolytic subunit [Gammaproteobacteria bacterium]
MKSRDEFSLKLDEIMACHQLATPAPTFPFYLCKVPAGFPAPTDDTVDRSLDLNELLIQHPAATFFVRVNGHSMIDANIFDQDILIVDRSVEPTHGKIVVAAVESAMTVKRLHIGKNNHIYLMPENPNFTPITVDPEQGVYIWGVVTHIIHATGS